MTHRGRAAVHRACPHTCPSAVQHYPEHFEMFQKLDSIIKRADAIRYFIMHAIGGAACLLRLHLQLPLLLRVSPLACAAWQAPALPLLSKPQPACMHTFTANPCRIVSGPGY